MQSPTSSPSTTPPVGAAIELESVHLDHSGGEAIRLREHLNDQEVGGAGRPEWVRGRALHPPAAYVRATRPSVLVVFRGTPANRVTCGVGADGTVIDLPERRVTLEFDPVSGLSAPTLFQARRPLPDRIGVHDADLRWYLRQPADSPYCASLGATTHRVYTTWQPMDPDPRQELESWAYRCLVEWTCAWAEDADDEKAICDAILRGLPSSGLRYGHPPRVRDRQPVRHLLLNGGGMCGEWYRMFQALAHCQGVRVHRRAFLVDWRVAARDEVRWCALVVRRGGQNQPHPNEVESDFHDSDSGYPSPGPLPVAVRRERRYQFFGSPGALYDGHCVNFLVHRGRLFLYDACFGIGPVEIAAALPVPDPVVARGGAELAPFRDGYLNDAIDYMLGSLYNGVRFYECQTPAPGVLGENGLTVRTVDIPDVVAGGDGLTFFWVED